MSLLFHRYNRHIKSFRSFRVVHYLQNSICFCWFLKPSIQYDLIIRMEITAYAGIYHLAHYANTVSSRFVVYLIEQRDESLNLKTLNWLWWVWTWESYWTCYTSGYSIRVETVSNFESKSGLPRKSSDTLENMWRQTFLATFKITFSQSLNCFPYNIPCPFA